MQMMMLFYCVPLSLVYKKGWISANNFLVGFNADKSKLIVYSNNQPSVNNINITFQGKDIFYSFDRSSYSTTVYKIKRMHHNNMNDDKVIVQLANELISSRDFKVSNLIKENVSFLLDYILCDWHVWFCCVILFLCILWIMYLEYEIHLHYY